MKVWRDSNRSPNSAFRMITLLGVISYIIHGDHILIPSILYNIILLLFECSYSLVYYITVSSVFVVVVVCCWRGSPRIWSCVMARFMKLSWRWLAAGSTTLSLSLRVWCHQPPFPSSFYFFFFFLSVAFFFFFEFFSRLPLTTTVSWLFNIIYWWCWWWSSSSSCWWCRKWLSHVSLYPSLHTVSLSSFLIACALFDRTAKRRGSW